MFACGGEYRLGRFGAQLRMILGAEEHVAPLLPHVGIEGDIDRRLVGKGDAVPDTPHPADAPIVDICDERVSLADQGHALSGFHCEAIAFAKRACAESCEDRFVTQCFAPSPTAADVLKKTVVRRCFAAADGAQMLERAHAPSPPAIWRNTETSSNTVKSSTILPPRTR